MDLRVGDMVEVKPREEILETLDSRGTLDGLPFMPEMLKHCGKRYKVYRRADKTAQYITAPRYTSRRMFRTVHLGALRCDGEFHDGCDALCLLYWKEAWLSRIDREPGEADIGGKEEAGRTADPQSSRDIGCTVDALMSATKTQGSDMNPGQNTYFCQVTEVLKASSELKWWDVRQYFRDISSGNIGLKTFAKWSAVAILNRASERIWGERIYPFIDRSLMQREKTPHETLNLKVGDRVQIKSLKEILQTLDVNMKNRGLLFTKELIPYCGGTSKVIKIVNKIINEVDGKMITFSNACVILEDVICTGYISDKRLFCQKSCYPYWREIWLKKM